METLNGNIKEGYTNFKVGIQTLNGNFKWEHKRRVYKL